MCDLQQKTALHDRDSHSILITSVITWYEVDEVAVEALQRRRASSASVNRKLEPALLQGTRLTVQLEPSDVLDAADMPLQDSPLRLDALVVEETHPHGVAARRGVEDVDQRLYQPRRLIRAPGPTATVSLQLLASDLLRDIDIR